MLFYVTVLRPEKLFHVVRRPENVDLTLFAFCPTSFHVVSRRFTSRKHRIHVVLCPVYLVVRRFTSWKC
jgi:hypothetical protein